MNDLTARKMYKNMERIIANLLERIRIFRIIYQTKETVSNIDKKIFGKANINLLVNIGDVSFLKETKGFSYGPVV